MGGYQDDCGRDVIFVNARELDALDEVVNTATTTPSGNALMRDEVGDSNVSIASCYPDIDNDGTP
jgi:hypothetical protein